MCSHILHREIFCTYIETDISLVLFLRQHTSFIPVVKGICVLLKCFGIWKLVHFQPSLVLIPSCISAFCLVCNNLFSLFFLSLVLYSQSRCVSVCRCVCNLQSTSFYGNIISSLDMYALTNTPLTHGIV